VLRELVDLIYPAPLYPNSFQGEVCIWQFPSKKSIHLSLEEVRSLDAEDHGGFLDLNKSQCLYLAHSLFRPGLEEEERGGKDDVVAMSSIVVDIDLFDEDGAHKAKNLPRNATDVAAILARAGTPDPSLWVQTGHGLQLWWVCDAPVIIDSTEKRNRAGSAIRNFQDKIIEAGRNLGFHVDRTDSIDRVWRIPGFTNRKVKDKPVPVLFEYKEGPRHMTASLALDFDSLPADAEPSKKTKKKASHTTSREKLKIEKARAILERANFHDPQMKKLLAGESFADADRDDAMQSVCSSIVFALKGAGDPEVLVELLEPSLKIWAEEPTATLSFEEERDKAIDKLTRAQSDYDAKTSTPLSVAKGMGIALGDTKLTEKHLIIQKGRSYYIYVSTDERYAGPFIKEEILPAVRDYFNFDITYHNDKGEVKKMQVPMLLEKYGTIAEKIQGSLSLRVSKYDRKENTFMIATTPLRKLEPRFDEQIDTWLRLMAVDKEDTEQILDYVAGVSQLHRPCAALHLMGPPGTGKSVFINGLSKLWTTGGATPYRMAVGAQFNESIARCPLIELSEGMEKDLFHHGTSSAFRDLIGSQEVTINPKGFAPYSVVGCARVVVASNDYEILRDITGSRELSNDSLEAVAERLAIVPVGLPARDYMDALKAKDPHTIDRWLQNDLLARHALHLRDSRKLSADARFLVRGKVTAALQTLVVHRQPSEALLEWIVGYATDPAEFEKGFKVTRTKPHSRIGNGELCLNSMEIQKGWTAYMDVNIAPKPSVTALGRMLSKLGKNGSANERIDGKQARVRQIDPTYPINFSLENQIGDVELIKANLERKID